MYIFYVDGTRANNVVFNGGDFIVTMLRPGQCYKLQVMATNNNRSSPMSTATTACTRPSVPVMLQTASISDRYIILNITTGTGNVEYFQIYVNSKEHGTVMASKGNYTLYVMSGLESGTVYLISCTAVANGINSILSQTLNATTYPSPPKMVQFTDRTEHSVSINITKGPGRVEYFNVFVNGNISSKVTPSDNNGATQWVITGLKPGTTYNIWATAVSYKLNSQMSPMLIVQTDPVSAITHPTSNCYSTALVSCVCIGSSLFTAILALVIWIVIRPRLLTMFRYGKQIRNDEISLTE